MFSFKNKRNAKTVGAPVRLAHVARAAIETLEGRQMMSAVPGSLDTGFNFDGGASASIPGYQLATIGTVIQPDGKVVVASIGANSAGVYGPTGMEYTLTRFTANGQLDMTFGNSGQTQVPGYGGIFLQANSPQNAGGLAMQPDGKFVLVGQYNLAALKSVAMVMRFTSDGHFDKTFSGGLVFDSVSAYDRFADVAVMPNGQILCAGEANGDVLIAKYNANGSLDQSFGYKGNVITDLGTGHDWATAIALAPGGKIMVSGTTEPSGSNYEDIALLRYDGLGQLDNSFNGNGAATFNAGKYSWDRTLGMTVQPDGKVLVCGVEGNFTGMLRRFTANGAVDPTFKPLETSAQIAGLSLLSDGTIVAADTHFHVYHLAADGTKDATFQSPGVPAQPNAYANAMTIANGKIIVTGDNETGFYGGSIIAARYFAPELVNPFLPAAPTGLSLVGSNTTTSIHLQWTDNSNNETSFQIQRSLTGVFAGGGTTVPANTTDYTFTGLQPGKYYYFRICAKNADGISSYSSRFTTSTLVPAGATTLRVNAGGNFYGDHQGNVFFADNGFSGSTASTDLFTVGGTSDGDLYATNEHGKNFSYTAAVTNGQYKLKLYFADGVSTAAGQRVFDVQAEGKTVLSNFDIFKAAGGAKKAYYTVVNVTVTDGTLNLQFVGKTGNAMVSALELTPA